jgi:hypothetical protein
MSTPVPPSVVEPFCAGGTVDVDYTVIPVPSQTGFSPELASFATGFPVATRTPRTQGGIPPRGLDMNGILRMATAHTAWVAAGGQYKFNADVVANVTGYPVDAILQSAVDPTRFYLNTLANNPNDPDSVLTGWVPFTLTAAPTGLQSATLPAGSSSVVVTPSVGFLELTGDGGGTSAVLNITGGVNGQILVVSNVAAPFVTLLSSGNLRLPVDLTLLQNDGQAFRYSSALTKWVKM